MHTKTKGDIAELAVALRLVREGWKVLFPYGENSRYDLVAEKQGRFVRIQVKYVTPKHGLLYVNCRSSNNWSTVHYTAEDIDIIAVYDPVSRSIYFVPTHDIRKSAMMLRLRPTKNNQKARVRYASDFSELRDCRGQYLLN